MKNLMLGMSLVALLSAPAAFAKSVYHCNAMSQGAQDVTLTIGSSHFVKVDEDVAQLDQTYDPRLNEGYSRFEYQSSMEGTTEVLVQDRLLKGSRTGFIKVQWRGEGFDSQKFACTQQD